MLTERLIMVLISLPLLSIVFVSVCYYIEFGKEGHCGSNKQNIPYN